MYLPGFFATPPGMLLPGLRRLDLAPRERNLLWPRPYLEHLEPRALLVDPGLDCFKLDAGVPVRETGDQIALSDEIPLIHLDFLDDPFDLGSHVCVLDGQDREAPCDPQLHPDQNDTRQKKDEQDETRRPPVYRREALSLRKDLFERISKHGLPGPFGPGRGHRPKSSSARLGLPPLPAPSSRPAPRPPRSASVRRARLGIAPGTWPGRSWRT